MPVVQETDVAAAVIQDVGQRLLLVMALWATHIGNDLSSPSSDRSGW